MTDEEHARIVAFHMRKARADWHRPEETEDEWIERLVGQVVIDTYLILEGAFKVPA